MFKSNTVHLFSLVVLGFGLASCGRDQKSAARPAEAIATSTAQLPLIVRDGNRLDALAWDQDKNQALKMTDWFEPGGDTNVSLRFRVVCNGSPELAQSTSFHGEGKIEVFRILPKPLLTKDLREFSASCQITFNVDNRKGQPLRGHTVTARILEGEDYPAKLNLSKTVEVNLVAEELYGFNARFENAKAAYSVLTCENIESAKVPFNTAQDLSIFDMRLNTRTAAVQDAVTNSPAQNCRLVIFEHNVQPASNASDPAPLAVTQLFKLNFKGRIWQLKQRPVPSLAVQARSNMTVPLNEWELVNFSAKDIYVRIPQDLPQKIGLMYLLPSGATTNYHAEPWGRVSVSAPGVPYQVANGIYAVPAHSSFILRHEAVIVATPCENRALFLRSAATPKFFLYADRQGERQLDVINTDFGAWVSVSYDKSVASPEDYPAANLPCGNQ